jgi:hypothetical protein
MLGCVHQPSAKFNTSHDSHNLPMDAIEQFSSASTDRILRYWTPLVIFHDKKPTQYNIVIEKDIAVLHAFADEASSGLTHNISIDPFAKPWLHWRWKIGRIVETSDKTHKSTEDSPARIILGFDGDKETLSFADQILFETAKVLTGHDFPYATLMYIWDKSAPVGTIMTSRRSSRIKMIVVANGENDIATWQSFARNITDDFEKAFGEKPNKLIGVGVLTDTDNLGERVESWYGDIHLQQQGNN